MSREGMLKMGLRNVFHRLVKELFMVKKKTIETKIKRQCKIKCQTVVSPLVQKSNITFLPVFVCAFVFFPTNKSGAGTTCTQTST